MRSSGRQKKKSTRNYKFGRLEGLEDRIALSLNPTGYEQEILEHVNRMRLDPAAELDVIFLNTTDSTDSNYFRTADANVNAALDFFNVDINVLQSQWAQLSPTSPLAWADGLMDAATAHSTLMQQHNSQSHQLPGEAGLLDRIVSAGYNWSGSISVGENVFVYAQNPFYAHAGFAIDWGFTSSGIQEPAGHRNNIMSNTFQEVGVGVVQDGDPVTSVGPLLVTQDFGHRGNYGDARLLGVAFADVDTNGLYDAGEGEGGITITAVDMTNPQLTYTTTTMSAGWYQMAVAPGTYSLTASGGSLTGSVNMGTATVGTENEKIDLETLSAVSQLITGSIAGIIFHDSDSSGDQNPGEAGIKSWTVYIDTNNDGNLDGGEVNTTTDASGGYLLNDLTAGSYTVKYVDSNSFGATSSTDLTVSVTSGDTTSGVNFGVFQYVTISGNVATVHGTSGDDVISLAAGQDHVLTVNGVTSSWSSASVTQIDLHGEGGRDSLSIVGTSANEAVTMRPGEIEVAGQGFNYAADGVEDINVNAGSGTDDRVEFFDGTTDDRMAAGTNFGLMRGVNDEYYNFAIGFDEIRGYATNGGLDYVTFYDSANDDTFTGRPEYSELQGAAGEYYYYAEGFDQVYTYADNGGTDQAYLHDSSSNDRYLGYDDHSIFLAINGSFYTRVEGFAQVTSYATAGGTDEAYLYDGTTDDRFMATNTFALMRSITGEFYNLITGFDTVRAYAANGGTDYATLYDSPASDRLTAFTEFSILEDPSGAYYNRASGFDAVLAYGTAGGNDVAYMYDGSTNDRFIGEPDTSVLFDLGGSFYNRGTDFEQVYAFAFNGGNDEALLYDSALDDRLIAGANFGLLRSLNNTYYNYVSGFDSLSAYSTKGGTDYATLYDGVSNDRFTSYETHVVLEDMAGGFYNYAAGFKAVFAYSTGGADTAVFFDSVSDDFLYGRSNFGFMSGNGFFNRANNFATVEAHGINGGNNTMDVIDVDYALAEFGNWS